MASAISGGNLGEAMTIGEAQDVLNSMDDIDVGIVRLNHTPTYNGKKYEIDGMGIGEDMVVVIETKNYLERTRCQQIYQKNSKCSTKLCLSSQAIKSTAQWVLSDADKGCAGN